MTDTWRIVVRAAAVALLMGAVQLGCNTQKTAWQAGLPGVTTQMVVESATPRGFALQAHLEGDGWGIDTFAPRSETCSAMLQPGQEITFLPNLPRGRFRVDETDCDAIGIGSLASWRDRSGRAGSPTSDPIPRAQANFRIVYEDDELIFLRGFFPLTSRLAWPGGQDTIAVVPNSEICRVPSERGVASMEFRPRGRQVLSLVSSGGLCAITGLIQPLPQAQPASDEGLDES